MWPRKRSIAESLHPLSGMASDGSGRTSTSRCGSSCWRRKPSMADSSSLIDATLASQAGKKTQNTYSTGRQSRPPPRQGSGVLQQEQHRLQEMLQLHPSPAHNALRHADPVPDSTLYPRVLCRARRDASHDRRSGRRYMLSARAFAGRRPMSWCWAIRPMMQGLSAKGMRLPCGYVWIFPRQPRTRLRRAAGDNAPSCDLDSRIGNICR